MVGVKANAPVAEPSPPVATALNSNEVELLMLATVVPVGTLVPLTVKPVLILLFAVCVTVASVLVKTQEASEKSPVTVTTSPAKYPIPAALPIAAILIVPSPPLSVVVKVKPVPPPVVVVATLDAAV